MRPKPFWPTYERPLVVSRAEYANVLRRRNTQDAGIIIQWLQEGFAVLEGQK